MNKRRIEIDALTSSALIDTQGGNGGAVDLSGASRYSIQAVYTVGTYSTRVVASAAITFGPDPGSVFTFASHGFVTGLGVTLTTSSALPSGLLVATTYYVIRLTANTFRLASSLANAIAGTFIELGDAGVGNQSVIPTALAGATVLFQESNDGATWVDIQAATAITATGSIFYKQPASTTRYVRVVKAITTGSVALAANILVIGDAM